MTHSDLADIGKTLSQCRRDKKLTQAQLGQQAGIDRQTISEIENGRFTGSLSILLRYLRFANMTLSVTPNPYPYPTLETLKDRYGDEDD